MEGELGALSAEGVGAAVCAGWARARAEGCGVELGGAGATG